jgi:16S rRNA (guanine527-N7)-methyltransferase
VRRDLKITALDSTGKRIDFVTEAASRLGLENVDPVCARAEDFAVSQREKFDVCTSRAVARMNVLSELCVPFVKIGGTFIAMKGKNAEFELSSAKKAIAILGGSGVKVESISLESDTEILSHPLIIVNKKTKTPASYPRAFAQISKKPL